ncbi:CoA-transferase subunit beta [Nakamurella lactea]|uniref:CoA-transferase subunit beta n=1 Tax=Nakamurella lactea TaxID=459515 RepID=UPI0004164311|nr:CoA-transferase [Nakamurella lactea]
MSNPSSGDADSSPAADYTVDELMTATLARCLSDGDQITNGISSFMAVCAIELARRTHAPDLVWIAGGSGLDPLDPRMTDSTFEWPIWQHSSMYFELSAQFWDYVANPRFLSTFFVGAAQIDAHGNTNLSVIGDFHHPRARLPGTAGLADMSALDKRLIYWVPDHSRRTLVERVDFRSGAGYLDGDGERERLGIGGGPELVVTNLAVFDFTPISQRLRLRSVHHGIDLETVLAATGFEPVVDGPVGITPPPSVREVTLLRTVVDPQGLRSRGVRQPREKA